MPTLICCIASIVKEETKKIMRLHLKLNNGRPLLTYLYNYFGDESRFHHSRHQK